MWMCRRVNRRAAIVFQIERLSQLVNSRKDTLVSQLKGAQDAAKGALAQQHNEQLKLLALLSKINVIIAVARGLNNVSGAV